MRLFYFAREQAKAAGRSSDFAEGTIATWEALAGQMIYPDAICHNQWRRFMWYLGRFYSPEVAKKKRDCVLALWWDAYLTGVAKNPPAAPYKRPTHRHLAHRANKRSRIA